MKPIGNIETLNGCKQKQGYFVYMPNEYAVTILTKASGMSGAGGALYMIDCREEDGTIIFKNGVPWDELGGSNNVDIASQYRIRKLTPLSCWRLMGFTEEDFLTAKTGSRNNARKYMQEFEPDRHLEMMQLVDSKGVQKISSSQLYKQAGNSITTCTLYYIYKNLYEAMPYLFDGLKVGSFFSGIGAFEKALDMLQEDLRDGKKPFFVIEEE